MLEIIKSFFSPVGGGRTSFASQNGNQSRKEDLRQGRNLVSNSDFNRKRGGSVLNLPSFASENIVGGGQLRSIKIDAGCGSLYGCNSVVSSLYFTQGGEGVSENVNSCFADTDCSYVEDAFCMGGVF